MKQRSLSLVPSTAGSLVEQIKPVAWNLGIWFDGNLGFEQHTTKLVQSCFRHLRNISKIRSIITFKYRETIQHAFISSRLDHCNSLFTCQNQKSIDPLQTVHNSAARLLTRTKKCDHISAILASLHWLPVCFKIDFKISLITFKALHGCSPCYIPDFLVPYLLVPTIRSKGRGLLSPPEAWVKTKGDRTFAVRALRLLNNIPEEIRLADSVISFKSLLKTYLLIVLEF